MNFARRFLQRHEDIKNRLSDSMYHQRLKSDDSLKAREWFERFREVKMKYGLADEDIYSFDELEFRPVNADRAALGSIVRREISRRDQHNTIIVMECINAAGWALPPLTVVEDENVAASLNSPEYEDKRPKGCTTLSLPSDYIKSLLALRWINEVFDPHTRDRTIGKYMCIICYRHTCHESPLVNRCCMKLGIILMFLPLHTPTFLQPLDMASFAPSFIESQGTPANYLQAYTKARDKALSTSNIINSFRKTGLIPYDPDRVLSKLEVPSQLEKDRDTTLVDSAQGPVNGA